MVKMTHKAKLKGDGIRASVIGLRKKKKRRMRGRAEEEPKRGGGKEKRGRGATTHQRKLLPNCLNKVRNPLCYEFGCNMERKWC